MTENPYKPPLAPVDVADSPLLRERDFVKTYVLFAVASVIVGAVAGGIIGAAIGAVWGATGRW